MAYQMSQNLAALLEPYRGDAPIDLRALSAQVVPLFDNKAARAKSLLNHVTGSILPGTLSRHLFDCIAVDSVARDVLTTGHLAKLLSRLDVLMQTSDPRVVGLPNSIFDERSQIERAEFFRTGNILPIDAEVLKVDGVGEMLKREQ